LGTHQGVLNHHIRVAVVVYRHSLVGGTGPGPGVKEALRPEIGYTGFNGEEFMDANSYFVMRIGSAKMIGMVIGLIGFFMIPYLSLIHI